MQAWRYGLSQEVRIESHIVRWDNNPAVVEPVVQTSRGVTERVPVVPAVEQHEPLVN